MLQKIRLLPLVLLIALFGCGQDNGGGGTAPQISSFTANPTTITAPGQAVTLTWQVTGSATSLDIQASAGTSPGTVSGTSLLVNPTETTTYTLTASNSAGSSNPATATVTLGDGTGPTPGDDGAPPVGNFSVSLSQDSGFVNDRPDGIRDPNDPRILRAQPGGTFYALVSYSDPAGITAVDINLVNSSPPGLAGTLVQGQDVSGFTLVGEIAGCDLSGAATSINCIYQIDIGSDVQNITQLPGAGSEFAYVFRTMVTDAGGNVSDEAIRGYVTVGSSGGGTTTGTGTTGSTTGGTTGGTTGTTTGTGTTGTGTTGTGTTGSTTGPTTGGPTTGGPTTGSPTTYTLTVTKQGTAASSGTVTSQPSGISCGSDCTQSYNSGTPVTLTAVAASGSTFAGWSGGGCSGTSPCQVTMNQARNVTATFNTSPTTPGNFTLTVNNAGNGSGTVSGTGINCGTDCTESYPAGTTVTLNASAASGSTFAGWSGACTNATGTCQVTMNQARNVTATFNTSPTTPGPTQIVSFNASPAQVTFGGEVTFTWQLSGSEPNEVRIRQVGNPTSVAEDLVGDTSYSGYKPANSADYYLEVVRDTNEVIESPRRRVNVAPAISNFTSSRTQAPPNTQIRLTWGLAGPTPTSLVLLTNGANPVNVSGGSHTVTFNATSTYRLTASNGPASSFAETTVRTGPAITDFTSSEGLTIAAGETTQLRWTIVGGEGSRWTLTGSAGTGVNEGGTIGSDPFNGIYNLTVPSPTAQTAYTYTLAVSGAGNPSRPLTITVTP